MVGQKISFLRGSGIHPLRVNNQLRVAGCKKLSKVRASVLTGCDRGVWGGGKNGDLWDH